MPRVRFTAQPKLPADWADRPYREGWEGEMSDDEAARWVRRGVAEIVSDHDPEAVDVAEDDEQVVEDEDVSFDADDVVEPVEFVEIPDDWRDQHHATRMALARRLTDEEVSHAAEADEIIAAEVERRATEAEDHPAPGHHQV